jgi:catechol 2,3-dioxygenase-like lactoylglutathione lyase family enzyme
MEAMRGFYGRTLRFQFVRELSSNWVEDRIGPNTLALAASFRFVENPTLGAGIAAVQLAFRVPYESVDVCATELTAAGIPLLSPPTDQPWRHRTLFFRDPDGNLLESTQNSDPCALTRQIKVVTADMQAPDTDANRRRRHDAQTARSRKFTRNRVRSRATDADDGLTRREWGGGEVRPPGTRSRRLLPRAPRQMEPSHGRLKTTCPS